MALRNVVQYVLCLRLAIAKYTYTCYVKNLSKSFIEVKSFGNPYGVKESVKHAAKYALQTNHQSIIIAIFVSFSELAQLPVTEYIDDDTIERG